MSDELTRTQQWIYETLTGDAAITAVVDDRVFAEIAPPGTTHPFVVFALVYPRDVTTAFHERIMVEVLLRIRCVTVAESFDADLQTVADRIDTLLDRSDGGTAGGAVVFASVREEPVMAVEVDEGIQYRSLGGVFRIYVQL